LIEHSLFKLEALSYIPQLEHFSSLYFTSFYLVISLIAFHLPGEDSIEDSIEDSFEIIAPLFLGVSVRLNLTVGPCQGFASLRAEYRTGFAALLVPHADTPTICVSHVRRKGMTFNHLQPIVDAVGTKVCRWRAHW